MMPTEQDVKEVTKRVRWGLDRAKDIVAICFVCGGIVHPDNDCLHCHRYLTAKFCCHLCPSQFYEGTELGTHYRVQHGVTFPEKWMAP